MQLSTRLRTWALVAGLTGLLIALGALIGGSFLWLFVALAVAMNLAGYYYSDRLALRAAHAQPLTQLRLRSCSRSPATSQTGPGSRCRGCT
jgi:heat shock protein HtpX